MERKKIIYFGLLLIVAVLVIVTSFSYAFLIKTEEHHGKLNMVVGTLDYKLSSKLLNNNSITLNSNEKAKLNIKIESLNNTDSKYELYYTTTNNSIEIGYTTLGDQPTGTINANKTKSVNVVIKNTSNTSATVTFGIIGGFTGNTLVKETGASLTQYTGNYCSIAANTVYDFPYNGIAGNDGSGQEFDVPCSGKYKVELWGASGSDSNSGKGGYTSGNINMNQEENYYVYVGGKGQGTCYMGSSYYGGYNGGGFCSADNNHRYWETGGGSTDIRLVNGTWNTFDSQKSRIMIAAGGGGGFKSDNGSTSTGGSGGGLSGYNATNLSNYASAYGYAMGATQTAGGLCNQDYNLTYCRVGSFGQGGNTYDSGVPAHSGGGGGYYGGAQSGHVDAAAGGSSYISGYNGCDAITEASTENNIVHTAQPNHYSKKIFTNSVMIDGTGCDWSTGSATSCGTNQPQPDGTNATGHSGNGYARITYLGESNKEEKTTINYIVTFNSNGGTSEKKYMLVPKGTSLANLPTPTKGNEYFKGWYLESTLTTKVDENYVPTSDITLYAKWKQEIVVNRSILDQGVFRNVTPTYLTNQVDGTDGFTILGTATGNNTYRDGCYYCQRSAILRWDYTIDLTDIDKITFYARQDALHGTIDVRVTDGIFDDPDLGPGTTVYASAYLHYSAQQTAYKYFEIDTSEVTGTHVVSFIGGYGDRSGSASSSTTYSNIRFVP